MITHCFSLIAICLQPIHLSNGKSEYLGATTLVLLCDCGGRINARYYLFKEELQRNYVAVPAKIAVPQVIKS